jgi:hypothetical protein
MRGIITIVALCSAVAASGQIYIDSYRFASASGDLLLDSFPGAAAAYSLRKLDKDYAGSAIMVRRSSDGDSLNIGFSGNYLDTVAMKTFCGTTAADSCFVRTWYDQGANGNHARMTTNHKQFQIMRGGAIIYRNGEVALETDGVDARMTSFITQIQSSEALCVSVVYSSSVTAAADVNSAILWNSGIFSTDLLKNHASSSGVLTGEFMILDVRTTITGSGRLGSSTYRRNSNTQVVESILFLSTGTTLFQNNNQVTLDLTAAGATTSTNFSPAAFNLGSTFDIGALNDLVFSPKTWFQELIVYPTNIATNRSAITTNINNFYTIY